MSDEVKTEEFVKEDYKYENFEIDEKIEINPTIVHAICLVDAEQVLITQHKDGTYRLPGGTVEPGESTEQTLRREIYEETAAKVLEYRMLTYSKVWPEDDESHVEYHLKCWAKVELLDESVKDPSGSSIDRLVVTLEELREKIKWSDNKEALLQLALEKYR